MHDTWLSSTDVTRLITSSPWRKYICSLSLAWAELPSYDTTLNDVTYIKLSADRYSGWTRQKTILFSGHYLRNRSTLDIGFFGVISVYFNIRNTLPKSGPFLLGHPVYMSVFAKSDAKYRTGASTPITCSTFDRSYKKINIFILCDTFGIKLPLDNK